MRCAISFLSRRMGSAADFCCLTAQLLIELAGEGNRLKEPFLSPCLLIARAFVHNATNCEPDEKVRQDLYRLPTSSEAWNLFALRSLPIVSRYLEVYPVNSTTTNPFEHIIPILRQELVVTTLSATRFLYGHHQRSIVAVQRLLRRDHEAYSILEGDLKGRILLQIDVNEKLLDSYVRTEEEQTRKQSVENLVNNLFRDLFQPCSFC